jgi:hypothetical protein
LRLEAAQASTFGRLYDPEIGRMLGPDPIVQESDNTQNYNAYSYVLNNPMRFTDPSGYSWFGKLFRSIGKFFKKIARSIKKAFKKVRTWVKRNYKKVIVVAVAAVAIVVTYGAATAWSWAPAAMTKAGTVAFGAVSGGAMGAAQAAMAGGSWSDIFRAGVQGVVTGAIAAAIGGAVLHGWGRKALGALESKNYARFLGYHSLHTAGHGVVGGGLSELTGGNFKDGFIGAGFAAFLSPVTYYTNMGFGEPGTGNSWQYLGRTATAATIGGTVAAISGGKFGNGAATAAFMHVVNSEVASLLKGRELESAQARIALAKDLLLTSKAGQALYRVLDGTRLKINLVDNGALPFNAIANSHYSKLGHTVTMNFTPDGISVGTLAHELHHVSRQMYTSNFGVDYSVLAEANDWVLPVNNPGDRYHQDPSVNIEAPAVRAENIVNFEVHKNNGGDPRLFRPRTHYGQIRIDELYGRYKF